MLQPREGALTANAVATSRKRHSRRVLTPRYEGYSSTATSYISTDARVPTPAGGHRLLDAPQILLALAEDDAGAATVLSINEHHRPLDRATYLSHRRAFTTATDAVSDLLDPLVPILLGTFESDDLNVRVPLLSFGDATTRRGGEQPRAGVDDAHPATARVTRAVHTHMPSQRPRRVPSRAPHPRPAEACGSVPGRSCRERGIRSHRGS